jgi:hypothetical protein
MGRKDFVAAFYDDLSVGPIDYDDPIERAAWLNRELGMFDWLEFVEKDNDLALRCHAWSGPIVAWYNPGDARSYAGFQWWISQIGRTACAVLCEPDLNLHGVDAITDRIGHAVNLSDEARTRHHAEWLVMEQDNALLRIIHDNRLISVPLEYFDEAILGFMREEWQTTMRVVGQAMVTIAQSLHHVLDDMFVMSRLRALHGAGMVEWSGDRELSLKDHVRLAR